MKWLFSNQETVDQLIEKAQNGKLKATEYILSNLGNPIHYFRIIKSPLITLT